MKMTRILTTIAAIFAVSSGASAASSGTLLLQGIVGVVNDIVVTANGSNNTSLNITAGESAKLVGSAAETSNNLLGYKIFISSPTGGELRNTADATKKTTYKIAYNGGAAVTPTVAGVQVKNVASLIGLTTANSNINVDVTAYPTAPAGTYQDTLTVSIVAN